MEPNIAILGIVAVMLVGIWALSWVCAYHCPRCRSQRTVLTSEWDNGESWTCSHCGHHWIIRK